MRRWQASAVRLRGPGTGHGREDGGSGTQASGRGFGRCRVSAARCGMRRDATGVSGTGTPTGSVAVREGVYLSLEYVAIQGGGMRCTGAVSRLRPLSSWPWDACPRRSPPTPPPPPPPTRRRSTSTTPTRPRVRTRRRAVRPRRTARSRLRSTRRPHPATRSSWRPEITRRSPSPRPGRRPRRSPSRARAITVRSSSRLMAPARPSRTSASRVPHTSTSSRCS